MGKFDGVLLVSDYDDTLYNSRWEVTDGNRRAIQRFMAEGGRFTVATGRAWETFTPQIEKERIPFNAPVIVSNGSAIYDYTAEKFLYRSYLDPSAPAHMAEVAAALPELSVETYHESGIYAWNPNEITYAHLGRVRGTCTVCARLSDMPAPWTKIILEQDRPVLLSAQRMLQERWGELYTAIFSNPYLLEVTARGNDKGAMVMELARMLGIGREHVYCIGDNQNDLPMLAVSAIPFAPANCAPEVREWGARILCHCDDNAVAQAIGILDERYGGRAADQ